MSEEKTNWVDYVSKNPDTSAVLPEELKEQAQMIEVMRAKFNEKLQDVAQDEIELAVAQQDLFLKVRKNLKDKGMTDIFTKEVGFNKDALADGSFIVNIWEQRR